jgi:hypothetical protein
MDNAVICFFSVRRVWWALGPHPQKNWTKSIFRDTKSIANRFGFSADRIASAALAVAIAVATAGVKNCLVDISSIH